MYSNPRTLAGAMNNDFGTVSQSDSIRSLVPSDALALMKCSRQRIRAYFFAVGQKKVLVIWDTFCRQFRLSGYLTLGRTLTFISPSRYKGEGVVLDM